MDSKEILVYLDCDKAPILVGTVFSTYLRGKESFSFEYDQDFLNGNMTSVSLDPSILPCLGRQYPSGKDVFGFLSDASPDRWGRTLMQRRERIIAEREKRKPRKLLESDFLLGVDDETRMGALRFKTHISGPFLSNEKETPTPPWASIRFLEEASRNYEKNENSLADKWIRQLIQPASSLGGARPKATIKDPNEELWIAKFPSRYDEYDVGAWEMVVHDLAEKCGLDVPEARLERFSDFGSTFLVKRFDRSEGRRIHFESAMTLLGKNDGSSAVDGSSYLNIASFIKTSSICPKKDLNQLWKRIVFYMAVSNTDDHLRNHAFIYSPKGWKLSPMFDVNPLPFGNELALNVNEFDNSIDIELALSVSEYFNLSRKEAEEESSLILNLVKYNWRRLAKRYEVSNSEIELMSPAFMS